MTKDDVRDHILQVAGPIFAAEGYQATTVRKICEAAQVNVSAVNYYFGDKERLYIDAVKHAWQLIERRWPLPEWPVEMSPQQRLQRLIHTFDPHVCASAVMSGNVGMADAAVAT